MSTNSSNYTNTTQSALRSVFSFPNPVNEYAARTVAGMVIAVSLTFIITGQGWLLFVLAYGFLARVLTGPTLSPMGLLATRAIVPMLGNRSRLVPGPPKRFAQAVGLVFSATALLVFFVAGSTIAAQGIIGVLVLFAGLEAFVGFCAGCFVFGYLMQWGIIPQSVCRECVIRA